MDTYIRQRELDLYTPDAITIAGIGGIGSWVAILSAMSGIQNLYLFDPDHLEESNRNRLPFCQGSLNRPKVEVVKEYIQTIRPEALVVAIPEKLEGLLLDIQISVSDIIIDCTDSPRSQIGIYNTCKRHGCSYIRAGYDGTRLMVTSTVSGWIKVEQHETYEITPSWVVPAVIAGALVVGKMGKFHDQEVSLDMSEIGIPVRERQRKLTARCRDRG